MEFQAFMKEQRVLNPLTGGNPLSQKAVYKQMFLDLEAKKTPEQKTKERSDKALRNAMLKEKLKLFKAKKALKPIDGEKTEPVKAEPAKSEPKKVMPRKITTAWTAFVQKIGGVTEAAAAKKADSKAYEAFVAKWKKDNKWDEAPTFVKA